MKNTALLLLLTWFSLPTKPLTADSRLDSVYAPVVVGIPPCDAYIGLSLMPDGEIRHYNYGAQPDRPTPGYLSSRDHGFSWKRMSLPPELPYADQRSPISGEYIRLFCTDNGVYALRTEGGLEGGRTITRIDNRPGIMNKPPLFIRGGKRILSGAHRTDRSGAYVYYSDDDGRTWKASAQVTVPLHRKGGWHQGVRWNHGAVEPTIAELADGRLWMIMRTSQDRHYQSFSHDGGATWTPATPSPFYGTITMPTLYRMADGRLLFFWSNTTPLPELARADGVWEDVFTNRDAAHVAISADDGRTWSGFRELLLSPERNSHHYQAPADKSVHQVQAVEVAPGKMLVAVGQNPECRRLLLFDVNWLNEPRRSCDFTNGLEDWSAFRYYKGITGHCCYNRQAQPLLVPHPDRPGQRVLRLDYTRNDSLVQDNDGAVWNFPAARNGELIMRLQIPEKAARVHLILNDRWFNPTDSVARHECMYTLPLTRNRLQISDNGWHHLRILWQQNRPAQLYIDGKKRATLPVICPTEHGPSYLHLLGEPVPADEGVHIEFVEAGKVLL